MNKVVVRNVGYNFNKENLKFIESLEPLERIKMFYLLPNYQQLENTRRELTEQFGGIREKSLVTFDDLALYFSNSSLEIINKEKASWIIKKIIEKEKLEKVSESLGTASVILNYIQILKSNNINSEIYIDKTKEYEELHNIGIIFRKYEEFLKLNNLLDEIDIYKESIENIKNLDKNLGHFIINGFIDFRTHELEMLNALSSKAKSLTIQIPYLTKKQNSKLERTLADLENVGFNSIEKELILEDDGDKLGYEFYSSEENVYNIDTELIVASSKYYEVYEVFRNIEEKIEDFKLEDISIIANSEYEELVKSIADDFNLPISIMNKELAKDIPIVKSILKLLEFSNEEDKQILVSIALDNNINYLFSDKINGYFIQKLREFQFINLENGIIILQEEINKILNKIKIEEFKDEEEKKHLENSIIIRENLMVFFKSLEKFVINLKSNPIEVIEELLAKKEFISKKLYYYNKHKNEEILRRFTKGVEILKDSIEEIREFSKLVNLNPIETIEILIYYLERISYYSSAESNGIPVMDMINSIGSQSKIIYFLGMNPEFPILKSKGYLFSENFDKLMDNFKIYEDNIYDTFNNYLLQFSSLLTNRDKIVFSYTYESTELEEDKSILLEDYLKRIDNKNIRKISSKSMIKEDITNKDNTTFRVIYDSFNMETSPDSNKLELNYLKQKEVDYINNYLNRYYSRIDREGKYIGIVNNYEINEGNTKEELSFSNKQLNYYNECPFKYYGQYVLKFREYLLDYEDRFNLDKGIAYHSILKDLYEKNDDILTMSNDEIKKRIVQLLEDHFDDSKTFTDNEYYLDTLKRIYFKKLYNLVLKDIEIHQDPELEKFKPKVFEHLIERDFGNFYVYGNIDRIDEDENGFGIVIDYKSSSNPSKNEILNGLDLQLPIYGLLNGMDKTLGAFYGNIKYEKMDMTFSLNDSENFRNFLSETMNNIITDVEAIDKGVFIPNPVNDKNCQYCEYNEICRIEDIHNREEEISNG